MQNSAHKHERFYEKIEKVGGKKWMVEKLMLFVLFLFVSGLRFVKTTMRSLVCPRRPQTVTSERLIRSLLCSSIQTRTSVLGLQKHLKVSFLVPLRALLTQNLNYDLIIHKAISSVL
jgi:hypothetical protein